MARSAAGHTAGALNYALVGLIAGAAAMPGRAWAPLLAAARPVTENGFAKKPEDFKTMARVNTAKEVHPFIDHTYGHRRLGDSGGGPPGSDIDPQLPLDP